MNESFSLAQEIGQMLVVRASGYLFDQQIRYPTWEAPSHKLRYWLQDLNIGGVILLGGSAAELAIRTQQLQNYAHTPLLIAADVEEGVGQRFSGATWFPPPMALGALAQENLPLALDYATQMGSITAREALAIGINWLLAPIVDVNNNPDNPVINIRAFAETPDLVSKLATAFITGAKQYPIRTTAKHFPGHGDTGVDSHLDLPVLPHSTSRLSEIELPPFAAAIAAGVDSVMSAHLLIPQWDSLRPATLSAPILTGQLRENMGFDGLIVTDALIMGGVANYASTEEVAVMAIEAGADILLMPPEPEVAINALVKAVQSGRLSYERITQSLEKIKRAKERLIFSTDSDFVNLLSQRESLDTVASILKHTTLKGGNLPLVSSGDKLLNLIVVDNLLNCDFLGHHTPAIAYPQQLHYQLKLLDLDSLNILPDDSQKILLQVFIRGNPFCQNAGINSQAKAFYLQLLQSRSVEGVVIYGSPYVLDWFRSIFPLGLPWVFSYGQMPQAQAIALQLAFGLSVN